MSAPKAQRRALIFIAMLVLVLVAIIAPPLIQINRFRNRITDNIGAAIGRPVSADSVQFELLPRPAIVLQNFVIAEDPAFGEEPMLQAPTVSAQIRLSSLWRGRLGVARISLDDPSLNLTRTADGRWSLQNLLTTAAQATSKAEAANSLRAKDFPYIESTNARVNLKLGAEKTPFSLEEVNLAWSRESPGRWRVRLRGRPARTDIEVGDSGRLRIEGTFTSAASLDDVRVDLTANWDQLQMGQLTRMVHRSDAGWRGDVELQARVQGAIRDVDVAARTTIYGLRRSEFVPANSLDPVVNCTAKFAHSTAAFHDISCILPVADQSSRVEAHGTVSLAAPVANSDFTVDLDAIPAAALLDAARHERQNIAKDLRADGEANGSFRWDGTAWHGSAVMPRLSLLSSTPKTPVVVNAIRVGVGDAPISSALKRKKTQRPAAQSAANTWHLDPVQVDMGAPTPLTISAIATAHGFTVHWNGAVAWSRLIVLTELSAGLRDTLRVNNFAAAEADTASGDSDMDLTLRGPWFVDATQHIQVFGTLRAHNLLFTSSLLQKAVEIPDAVVHFTGEQAVWSGVARYAGSRIEGEITLPAHCMQDAECVGHFTLRAPQLDLATVIAAGRTNSFDEPFLAFLDRLRPSSAAAPWPTLSGSVHVGALTAGSLVIHDADAALEIGHRIATIKTMNGRALGGTLTLDGQVNAEDQSSKCKLHVTLHNIDTSVAATLFHETWNLGAGDVDANLSSSARSPGDLANNATGEFRFDLRQGVLHSDTTSLPFDYWSAAGSIADRKLTLQRSTMNQGISSLPVTGTVGFDRTLKLQLGDRADATAVTGTMSDPVINKP